METLVSLNREQGVTIVVVTHEADIAAYADRIVTMRDGRIVSDERVSQPDSELPSSIERAGRSCSSRTRSARAANDRRASVPSG